jgi:hypothetical protein
MNIGRRSTIHAERIIGANRSYETKSDIMKGEQYVFAPDQFLKDLMAGNIQV